MVMLTDMSVETDKIFEQYKNKKIAVYGLGTETERALHGLNECYEIVGLMDSFKTEGEIFGKQIISFDHAVDVGVSLIIVVARPGSCRAIAKTIGDRCRREGVALMDIRGTNLLDTRKIVYQFSNADGCTKAELEEKIKNADVISFDLFDTLVMRKTLSADDVAKFVNCRLMEKGIVLEDFCKKRLESEKELSRSTAPALIDIYQNILQKSNICRMREITAEELADLEWSIDFELLMPRKEVCDIFRRTVRSAKKVYIVTDTYYNKKQISQILKKCGITEYTDILSSCDYQRSKAQGLYKCLKSKEGLKKYLHIGDDIVSDIESADKCGLETYRVYSGLDLLEEVGYLGLAEYVQSLSDCLKVGMFISEIFNNPFQFENEGKCIEIHGAYEIGNLICGPIISDFVLWFYHQMQKNKFHNIWFSARDGYLIRKMYTYLIRMSSDRTVYFLTSRTAAIRAGVRDEKDIQYVSEMKFSGTPRENLKERFGIDILDDKDISYLTDENCLMMCKDYIFKKSQRLSENYQKYIRKLETRDGDIAFFDFVAKGTVQMYVQRLTENYLKGFYFLQLEKEHMSEKKLDIRSFYEDEKMDFCAVYNDYYILETILTAPHPSVIEFDEAGEPIFADETRTERNLQCIERAQKGVFEYFKTYIRLCPKMERIENKKLDEVFLELIHNVKITDADFLKLVVEDSFFNRMTDIADMI